MFVHALGHGFDFFDAVQAKGDVIRPGRQSEDPVEISVLNSFSSPTPRNSKNAIASLLPRLKKKWRK